MQNESTDPNQTQDSADGSEDLVCEGGFNCVLVQDTDSVVEKQHLGLVCACCHHRRLGLERTSRTAVEVGFRKRKHRLDGRAICGLHRISRIRQCQTKRRPSHVPVLGHTPSSP